MRREVQPWRPGYPGPGDACRQGRGDHFDLIVPQRGIAKSDLHLENTESSDIELDRELRIDSKR